MTWGGGIGQGGSLHDVGRGYREGGGLHDVERGLWTGRGSTWRVEGV